MKYHFGRCDWGFDVTEASVQFDAGAVDVEHCCAAWITVTYQPWQIMSLDLRDWAHGS
jgi:hypothetical protein